MKAHTLFTLLAITASISCSNSFTSLPPEEFRTEAEKPETQLVDVRTSEEHAQEHIPGSINIDVKEPTFIERATATLNKEKPVALYCRSGRRSKAAAKQLSQAGFNVVELDGGYNTWKERSVTFITYEIKYLLNSGIEEIKGIADKDEREKRFHSILADYDKLCKRHEKEVTDFAEKINYGDPSALSAKKEIETILEEISAIIRCYKK